MVRVLFVCTGNTCRSAMAEGVFRHLVEQRPAEGQPTLVAASAGTHATDGLPASPDAVAACREIGVDIHDHRSRRLTREMLAQSDLVLVMEGEHRRAVLELDPKAAGRVHLLGEFASGPDGPGVADPLGQGAARYHETLLLLERLLAQVWQKLVKRAHRS